MNASVLSFGSDESEAESPDNGFVLLDPHGVGNSDDEYDVVEGPPSSRSGPRATVPKDSSCLVVPVSDSVTQSPADLKQLIADLICSDTEKSLAAAQIFCEMLQIENPPIKEVVKAGVVPRFVKLLTFADQPKLQINAAWVLTNILSPYGTTEETLSIIEEGAVPRLIKMLKSPEEDVQEQALWTLSNIAGDGPTSRDTVFEEGVFSPLLAILERTKRLSTLRIAAWVLVNLCRGKPSPTTTKVVASLPVLAQLLHHSDPEVLDRSCEAIAYICNGGESGRQAVIGAGVCHRLIELLTWNKEPRAYVLRALGNIATGNRLQTQVLLDFGLLKVLKGILTRQGVTKRSLADTCWIISNVAAGPESQIQLVMDEGLVPILIKMMDSSDVKLCLEATIAVKNLLDQTSRKNKQTVIDHGATLAMYQLMSSDNADVLQQALEGLKRILAFGQTVHDEKKLNSPVFLIQHGYGLEKLQALKANKNPQISQKVAEIIMTYLSGV